MKSILIGCLVLITSTPIWAENWTLNREKSNLIITSVKNSSIAENHYFKNFNGQVTDKGAVAINVDLSSIETEIDIRNKRMKEHLFEVSKFSTASIKLSLPESFIESLETGKSVNIEQKFSLSLHGNSSQLSGSFLITKLNDTIIQVVNIKPIFIQAEPFDLIGGILKLQQLAGLSSIDAVVPVNLIFVFEAN